MAPPLPAETSRCLWADEHLQLMLSVCRLHLSGSPNILQHEGSRTAADKAVLLPPTIAVQKTVTLSLGDRIVLVSGLGDFRLQRRDVRRLATLLGTNARHTTINPTWAPAEQVSGLAEGMVSPFLPPGRKYPFASVVYLQSKNAQADRYQQVAVSLSLSSSLLIPFECLLPVLKLYAQSAYPSVPLKIFQTGQRKGDM